MDPATQKVVNDVPRFVIPEGKIITHSNSGAEPPAPPPAAPEKTSATPPEASPPKAAPEPAASEPATPPEKAAPEGDKSPEEKAEPGKGDNGERPGEREQRPASRSYERRVDRLTRKAAEERVAREAAEARLAEALAKQAPAADPNEPRADQFTDIEEFKKAVADHAVKKAESARDAKAKEESHKRELARLTEQWEGIADEGTAKYPDFHEKVGDLKVGVAAWSDAIIEADNGHEVAYHLANHPAEAERIINLPPRKQFLEIGKLSAKLAAQPAPVKTPSKAPPPIAPETGAASPTPKSPFEKQSFESYMQTRPKQFSGSYRS